MNRELRNRHRLMMTALAVVVPAVFVAGLAVRPDQPVNETLPESVASDFPQTTQTLRRASAWSGEVAWQVRHAVDGRRAIAITPLSESVGLQADGLLYWSNDKPDDDDWPPDDIYLLGAFGGRQERLYELPAAATDGGYIVLYSLATNTVREPGLQIESLEATQ